jgi:hypothetical protein
MPAPETTLPRSTSREGAVINLKFLPIRCTFLHDTGFAEDRAFRLACLTSTPDKSILNMRMHDSQYTRRDETETKPIMNASEWSLSP